MTQTFRKSTIREYFESIVIAVILALFVRTFVVQAFKIPTGSMENNLLIGDHLLVNKFVFSPTATSLEHALLPVREIHRGDVIVFKYPEEPDRDFIKRVIGTPGDTVQIEGTLAQIWASYDFHFGQTFSHCGVDAVQLLKTAEGWKIMSLADTFVREGCEHHPPPAAK